MSWGFLDWQRLIMELVACSCLLVECVFIRVATDVRVFAPSKDEQPPLRARRVLAKPIPPPSPLAVADLKSVAGHGIGVEPAFGAGAVSVDTVGDCHTARPPVSVDPMTVIRSAPTGRGGFGNGSLTYYMQRMGFCLICVSIVIAIDLRSGFGVVPPFAEVMLENTAGVLLEAIFSVWIVFTFRALYQLLLRKMPRWVVWVCVFVPLAYAIIVVAFTCIYFVSLDRYGAENDDAMRIPRICGALLTLITTVTLSLQTIAWNVLYFSLRSEFKRLIESRSAYQLEASRVRLRESLRSLLTPLMIVDLSIAIALLNALIANANRLSSASSLREVDTDLGRLTEFNASVLIGRYIGIFFNIIVVWLGVPSPNPFSAIRATIVRKCCSQWSAQIAPLPTSPTAGGARSALDDHTATDVMVDGTQTKEIVEAAKHATEGDILRVSPPVLQEVHSLGGCKPAFASPAPTNVADPHKLFSASRHHLTLPPLKTVGNAAVNV